jgi:Tfp pilus assembly protein FimT
MRAGTTLVELLLAVTLVAATTGLAVPAIARLRDRVSVRLAAADATRALADARSAALTAARRTAVRVDSADATLVVHAGADTLRVVPLAPYGVRLHATRDSIAFGPHGLGWGAATTTITLERGTARTALAVSRLGRVRRL